MSVSTSASAPASVFPLLESRLPSVQKPIQYVGGELNSTVKDVGLRGRVEAAARPSAGR